MSESKLRNQSMDFAVSIISLVKQLKGQRESIISNQIGRSGTSIGANIREAQSATVRLILLPSFRLHLRKRMKLAIGWNSFTKQVISKKQNIRHWIQPVQVFG